MRSHSVSEPARPSPASDSPAPRRSWGLIPLALIIFMLGIAIFGEKGLMRALQYKQQKETLELEMRQLEATNNALRQEIDKLRSDRRYIEGIARKELGMVRADEMVYQFPTRLAPVKPSTETATVPTVEGAAQ